MEIGIVGTGLMGKGIARNLKKSGNSVIAYRRNPDPAEASNVDLMNSGIRITGDIEDVFRTCETLVTCLPTSEVVEEVLIGSAGLLNAEKSSINLVLDFTTAKPDSTKKIAFLLKEKNIDMLDTPMGGGPQQAEEGQLKIIAGGDKTIFEANRSLLEPLASDIVYGGPSGSGHALKLVNNFMGILNQVTAAAVSNVIEKQGISRKTLIDFISVSGGNSWGFQNEMETVERNDFSLKFAMALALKDMKYAKDLFDTANFNFPIVNDLVGIFNTASSKGYDVKDVRSIYLYFKELLE